MIRTRTDLKLERHSKEANEHVSSGEVGDEQVGWLALQTPELSNLSSLVKCSNVQMIKCSNIQMFKCSNDQMFKISLKPGGEDDIDYKGVASHGEDGDGAV